MLMVYRHRLAFGGPIWHLQIHYISIFILDVIWWLVSMALRQSIMHLLRSGSHNWNPAVGKDCSGLYEGWYVCVGKSKTAGRTDARKLKHWARNPVAFLGYIELYSHVDLVSSLYVNSTWDMERRSSSTKPYAIWLPSNLSIFLSGAGQWNMRSDLPRCWFHNRTWIGESQCKNSSIVDWTSQNANGSHFSLH